MAPPWHRRGTEVPGPGVPGDLGPEPHAAGGHRTRDAAGAAGLGPAESVARQETVWNTLREIRYVYVYTVYT